MSQRPHTWKCRANIVLSGDTDSLPSKIRQNRECCCDHLCSKDSWEPYAPISLDNDIEVPSYKAAKEMSVEDTNLFVEDP